MSDAIGKAARTRAALLIDQGRPQAALDVLRPAMASNPQDAVLLMLLAQAEAGLGNHVAAIVAAKAAVVLEPLSVTGHIILGRATLAAGRVDEAEAAAKEATRLAPDDTSALDVLFDVEFRRKHRRAMDTLAQRMLALEPEEEGTQINAGIACLCRRRYAEAEIHFRAALRIQPMSAVAMHNVGVALQGQKRHEESMAMYARAAEIDPRFSGSMASLRRQAAPSLIPPGRRGWHPFVILIYILIYPARYRRSRRALAGIDVPDILRRDLGREQAKMLALTLGVIALLAGATAVSLVITGLDHATIQTALYDPFFVVAGFWAVWRLIGKAARRWPSMRLPGRHAPPGRGR